MTQVIEILEQLEQNGSRLVKEGIVDAHASNKLLQDVFRLSLDPYLNYGVAKIVMPQPHQHPALSSNDQLASFCRLLEIELAPRNKSGNAAKWAVESELAQMDSLTQKWAIRILLKNLRCGVSEKTVNKTWPNLVRRFEVMLATVVQVENNKPVGVSYPVRIEPKLDGLRLVTFKRNNVVTMYTRNGNEVETMHTISQALMACKADNFVLDGEILGKDWNESNSVVMSSKREKDDSNMYYNVFDMMSIDEWINQNPQKPLSKRVEQVSDFVSSLPENSHVKQVPGITANNVDDILSYYKQCLDDGFEGVMLKYLDAKYEFKRTKTLLKFKPIVTFEGAIVGWYKGAAGKKREGKFAGFEVMLENGVITRVGSGYTDQLKEEINTNGGDAYRGMIVELEAQPDPATADGLSKDGKARFPVFCRLRSVTDVDQKIIEAYEKYAFRT